MSAPVAVFVHGRGQEFRDPAELLTTWLAGLNAGLTRVGRPALTPDRVVFPFYGDVLYGVTAALPPERVRLESLSREEPGPLHPETPPEVGRLERELLRDLAAARGVPTPPAAEAGSPSGGAVRPEGLREDPLSWRLARQLLLLLAKRSRLDQLIIAAQVRDVAVYLTSGREAVLRAVKEALPADVPLVIVSHSLGTVVARDLLEDASVRSRTLTWVTTGSPLGLDAVQKNLLEPGAKHPGVPWLAAFDENDVVALGHPLQGAWGDPLTDVEVENGPEPHSISRYLAHAPVAEAIGAAVSP